MNVHILVIENENSKNIEAYPSRKALTARKTELKYSKCSMLPPIKVSRDAKGILFTVTLINSLHTRDLSEVMEELDDEYKDS